MDNNRKTILGVPVDAYQSDEFIIKIEQGLHQSGVKTIFAVNAEKIMFARRDPELFLALKEADFLIPDGFGPVVGLRLIYGKKVFRTTGIGLMEKLLDLSSRKDIKVFILGSKPEVIEIASDIITKKYQALNLVGTQHGYIPHDEYNDLIERINTLKTDILFVGLGSPKQEKWIYQYKKFLNVKFCLGIGGSLDVIAGKVPLAPSWISKIYLEWIYRLIREPSRFKRQKIIPKFILCMLKESILSKVRNEN